MAADTGNGYYSAGTRALGGAVAGIIAAIVMAIVAMINASTAGMEFWLPVKQIAALFYGVDALIEGTDAIIVGILIHMTVGAVSGAIFGLIVGRRLNAAAAFGAGLVYGVLIWAVMTWLILPWANETMYDRVMVMAGWWFVYHLIFGGLLLLTPLLVRAFASGGADREGAESQIRTRPA